MAILPISGQWVGPPVLVLQTSLGTTVLDGRKRKREAELRKLPMVTVTVYNHFDAIKTLILNGHPDRAAQHAIKYAPQYATRATGDLARLFGVAQQKLAPYAAALRSPAERHKLPRRAMSVVHKLRRLHSRAKEDERITVDDIADALGEFIK